MYCKTVDGKYYNLLTGTTLEVRKANAGDNFRVMVTSGSMPVACLQEGYKSEEDAQDALDNVMDSEEVTALEVPEYDEEEESEEELSSVDDYDRMSDDDLRALLAERQLSTTGKSDTMVNRLRKHDAEQSATV